MKLSAIFLSLLVVFIWGVNPAISKLGLQELPPFTFLTIRYTIVALMFLPFAKPTKKELGQLLFVAITSNVITNMLVVLKLRLTPLKMLITKALKSVRICTHLTLTM